MYSILIWRIWFFSDAMSLVHLELMGQNVNLLVNVKTEDLVILLLENVIAQKDGL